MMDVLMLLGPVLIVTAGASVIARLFGGLPAVWYVLASLALLAATLCIGLRSAAGIAADGGLTAATLEPLRYWAFATPIALLSLAGWLLGLWIWRSHQRRAQARAAP